MAVSFYVLMGILGGLSALNLLIANAQKRSKARTLVMWINGLTLAMVAIAVIIVQITK